MKTTRGRNAKFYPEKCAIALDGGRRLTLLQLENRAQRLSGGRHDLGLRAQDRLGVLSMNSVEFTELYSACEWAGYVLALYNFRLAPPEVAHLLTDSTPRVVFFESQYAELLGELRKSFPQAEHYMCMDSPVPAWALACEDVVARGAAEGPPLACLSGGSQEGHDYFRRRKYLFTQSGGGAGRSRGCCRVGRDRRPSFQVGEVVKAVIVPRAGVRLTAEELLEHCRVRIARFKCPKSFDFVAELPRLATGKIDKNTLRRQHH